MTGEDFVPELFGDAQRASRQIQHLHEAFIGSGSHHPLPEFSSTLKSILSESPDPDMSLNNLLRFSEATLSKASLFNDLIQYPVVSELLGKITGSSQYLADILVRDPGLFRWLTASEVLSRPVSKENLGRETSRIRETFAKPERRLDALKRLYRREFLRIGSQDFLGITDLSATTRQLSHLADIIVDEVLALSAEQLALKYPSPPAEPFAVIGLGKLGGEELNYSSDIDLMFIYDDERGGKRKAAGSSAGSHEYFNRLSERLVQNLSHPTAEGHLYRVDLRLRPESGAGPIARSRGSTLVYYESRGELWERQMLIKARPVAGDAAFGAEIIRQLQPFVYPRTFFENPAESVARIKARIEASVGDEQNIKLMPGGIRDIEFIVQTLQLINGGSRAALRESNTLRALQALQREALISAGEYGTLADCYVFLRTLEHRLQVVLNTQTHLFPSDKRTLATLARRMQLPGADDLKRVLQKNLTSVRSVYSRVLSVPTGLRQQGILTVIEGGVEEQSLHAILSSLGFRDTRQALRNLKLLTSGSALTDLRELDSRTRDTFRSVAPELFAEIAATPDPDLTFLGLTAILSSRTVPAHYYSMLSTGGFRRLLIDICRTGPRFARALAGDPLFLELLVANPGDLAAPLRPGLPVMEDLVRFKQEQELRAGVRHLTGFSNFDGLTEDLTALADAVVRKVTETEVRAARLGAEGLAVFGLGKYGTRELTFDADLDLFFVARGTGANKSRVENCAGSIMRRLSSVSGAGRLYSVDARLRPEGRNAPLVITPGAYEKYLSERSSLWERQSLTRLRYVAGGEKLAKDLSRLAAGFVYRRPLPAGWVAEISGMRKRMESRSRFHADQAIDLKVGAGGMVDIEFIAQMIQLKTGSRLRSIRARKTADVLAEAPENLIRSEESDMLRSAYRKYREVEKLLRVTLEETGSMLPDGSKLTTLARCLGMGHGEELKSEIRNEMKRTRKLFQDIGGRLES
jgi:[glutamine synthetase] adenylyltransferase / [glutamine synthetase]-adenylyl-L-tyrosine phosphorylase